MGKYTITIEDCREATAEEIKEKIYYELYKEIHE
jgi:hypothetical protein